MLGIIRECEKIVHEFRTRIAKVRSLQVDREDLRDHARQMVDAYFRTDRPILIAELGRADLLGGVDGLMQRLLRLAQGRSRRARYLDVLSALEREWKELEVTSLPFAQPLTGSPTLKDNQYAIAQTLERICPPAARSYRQALEDLNGGARTSWRGTASELREALRQLLDKLAPDDDVKQSPGFKFEDGLKAPTMKQKVRFILKSRKWSENERKQMEDSADVVEEKVGAFVRSVYSASSVNVHTEPTKKDVQSVLRFVETCLAELLELE